MRRGSLIGIDTWQQSLCAAAVFCWEIARDKFARMMAQNWLKVRYVVKGCFQRPSSVVEFSSVSLEIFR